MSILEPSKIAVPFADSGLKNPIPANSNNTTGKAGFDKGFPERTMLPKASGGIPPSGMDFNGILYDITSAIRYMQAGGRPTFDAAFAAAIGGYPSSAVLIGDDGVSVFQNAVDGNETDPNSGGAGWTRPDLQVMELYRRSYAEGGYNVVGTFQAGFTYANANDVGIDETTGKGFTGPAGPVAAGTDPASGGFVDKSEQILRGDLIIPFASYTDLRVSDGKAIAVYITDNVRFGVFKKVSGPFADDDATVIVTTSGAVYKRQFNGPRNAGFYGVDAASNDNSSAILDAISKGGGLLFSDGLYKFNSDLFTDYSQAGFPLIGTPSNRFDLMGSSTGNTILEYGGAGTALKLGGFGATVNQGINAHDRVGKFTLSTAGRTRTGTGLHLINKAHFKVEDLTVAYFDEGVVLEGCLTGLVSNLTVIDGNIGLRTKSSPHTKTNAVTFLGTKLKSQTTCGASLVLGGGNSFFGGTVEGNGTHGAADNGGMILTLTGDNGSASLKLDTVYYEGNAGVADLHINNATADNITVTIDECLFTRLSATRFTTSNIVLRSTGGGRLTLITNGCTFESKGTYVPSASRPFVDTGSDRCTWIDNGSEFSETVSLGPLNAGNYPTASTKQSFGVVNADGSSSLATNGFVASRVSAGVFKINAVNGKRFGFDASSYVANVTAQSNSATPISVKVMQNSGAEFEVRIQNATTGALIDVKFNWHVASMY